MIGNKWRVWFVAGGVMLAALAGSTHAATIFADSFDRPDNEEINASTVGITDNAGVGSPAYSLPYGNDNTNGGAPSSDGGDTDIVSNQLGVAIGSGTSNAYVNHNFVDPSILTAGGFSVSLEVTANSSQTAAAFGGAFAIGMSMAEADSAGDAFNPTGSTAPKMTEAFNVFNNGNPSNDALNDVGISDFWLALRANNTIAWGSGDITVADGPVAGIDVGANTGTISADFSVTDFNAGSTVGYTVFFNGVAQGSGTFQWSGTNENYIGLDARQSQRVLLDNFNVSLVPEPQSVVLCILMLCAGATGAVRRRLG